MKKTVISTQDLTSNITHKSNGKAPLAFSQSFNSLLILTSIS